MSANINEKTGIRYGVIQGNNCPFLMEEIFSNGEDLTYKNWKSKQINKLADAIAQACDCSDYRKERHASTIDEIAEQTFDSLKDVDFFFYESDESEYEYEDSSGNQFLLSYLGGAPLIWCIKTNRVGNPTRLCSPCVPNAGDLDSGFEDSPEGDTYGVPVEYLEEKESPISSPDSENLP